MHCLLPYLRYVFFLILFQPAMLVLGQNTFLKGGVNVSSVAGLREHSSLIAYHIGIGGLKDLSNKLSLKHEVNFSLQGAKMSPSGDKLHYYYLNMPVLLNTHLGKNLSFDAGPQFGIALNAIEKAKTDVDITANLNTLDISFCVGFNYLITKSFFVEGRFNLGLNDISRNPDSGTHRNAVFQGSLGYYFKRKNQEPK